MTGLGITILGTSPKLNLKPSQADDLIICIGKPKVGGEVVLENDTEIASYPDLAFLGSCDLVNEIVPCGSKGILYEAKNLAAIYQLQVTDLTDALDLEKSCGPATTLIASVKADVLEQLQKHFGERLNVIGRLTQKT
jgi:hypothetical protein